MSIKKQLLVLWLCCLSVAVFAQMGDSVVTIETKQDMDYVDINIRRETIVYQGGLEMKRTILSFKDNFWRDSSTTLNFYENGELKKSLTRTVTHGVVESAKVNGYFYVPHLNIYVDSVEWDKHKDEALEYWEQLIVQNIELKEGEHYFPHTTEKTVLYSDFMDVSRTITRSDPRSEVSIIDDTTFYIKDKIIKENKLYVDGELQYKTEYAYRFFENGKVAEKRKVFAPKEADKRTDIFKYTYEDTLLILVSKRSYKNEDSTNFSGNDFINDGNSAYFKSVSFMGGQVSSFILLERSKDERYYKSEVAYSKDSVKTDEWKTIKKNRRNKKEIWQYHMSESFPDFNGWTYDVEVRKKKRKSETIRIYHTKINETEFRKRKRIPTSECALYMVLEIDEKGRFVLLENYDYDTEELTRTETYTYSR